ncbi:hypothetical protein ACFY7C_12035 [Streptomyces sp. NPDC012769]|uniref:hypothetical protein n=1 Tax=Streptomyces sp. NPDC012769 TaxID=3364848 RepID=UPI0036A00CC9
MADRIHLTQEDDALRRARTDQPIREALRWIANRLNDLRPHAFMSPAGREAIALTAATETFPKDEAAAADLEHALLLRMPHVDGPVTRADYAQSLFRAAGRGDA